MKNRSRYYDTGFAAGSKRIIAGPRKIEKLKRTRLYGAVVAGALEIDPTSFGPDEVFGNATFSFGPIAPSAITSSEAFGTATFSTTALSFSPSGITSGEAFGTDTFSFGPVSPSGIGSVEAFGTATFSQGVPTTLSFSPGDIPSTEVFGNAQFRATTIYTPANWPYHVEYEVDWDY